MINPEQFIHDIGFVFFNADFSLHFSNDFRYGIEQIKEMRLELLNDLFEPKNYDNRLARLGIDEEAFSNQFLYCKLLLQKPFKNKNGKLILSFYLFKKYSVFLSNFWFLKPNLQLRMEQLNKLMTINLFYSFLERPLECSTYLSTLTEVDLNNDYFILKNKDLEIKKIKLMLYDLVRDFINSDHNYDDAILIIRKWR